MLARGIPHLFVTKRLVTAVAVGLVVAVFALTKVIVFAFTALECLRSEFAALVRTIAEGLFPTLAAGAKKYLRPSSRATLAGRLAAIMGCVMGIAPVFAICVIVWAIVAEGCRENGSKDIMLCFSG